MGISVIEVLGADFRTDYDSDVTNTEFMKHLGFDVRYMSARLAMARSLTQVSDPSEMPETYDRGKVIPGDTLFGSQLEASLWLSFFIERHGSKLTDVRALQNLVARHWRRGINLLAEEWKESGGDKKKFFRRLIDGANLSSDVIESSGGGRSPSEILNVGDINLPIGEVSRDSQSGADVSWSLNGPGSSPHIAIMGGVGSGKTRTAVAMLRALRAFGGVPSLVFDFKGDLGTGLGTEMGYRLDKLFDAENISPPNQAIPLDVFYVKDRSENGLKSAAQKFLDAFKNLKGAAIGAKQQRALFEACYSALRFNNPCTLENVYQSLRDYYSDNNLKEDGAVGALDEVCRFTLFAPLESPEEFFSKSRILHLPANMSERQKVVIVNLTLSALDAYLNSLQDSPVLEGFRSLRHLCVLDEAHRILESKVPSLSNLIRQSRSKGGVVMLISQSPDDFVGADDDFLSEMGLVVAFASNAKPTNVARLFGKGGNLAGLSRGHCLVKKRGEASGRRVVAWE